MNRLGLKQQQAADLIGVSQATISNWCKGKTPDYGTISKLITYGMTAQEIFGEKLGNELIKNSYAQFEKSENQPIKKFTREEVLSFLSQLSDFAKNEVSGSATENSTK